MLHPHHPLKRASWLLLLLFIFTPVTIHCEDEQPERCRGAYLRSELKVINTEKCITCELALLPNTQQPTLKLSCHTVETLQEIKLYEVRLRKYVTNFFGKDGKYEYTTIQDDIWRDSPVTSVRQRVTGLMANTLVSVNGVPTPTDANGMVAFEEIQMLEKFDQMDTHSVTFTISSRGYKPATFTVTRTIPERQPHDEKLIDEPYSHELLSVYKLNFLQSQKEPERNGLSFLVETPPNINVVKCGQKIPVKVTVTNRGSKATSCLIARSFSRIPGFNGRLFYFGAIPPNGSATFTRYIFVNPENLTNDAYAEIRFSDSWGVFNDPLKIQFPVIH